MIYVTRFAPSPTGRLHLGHAYSALLAHDSARARNGNFLLRIEDIDPTRSRPEHIDGIIEDLMWLGLEWDDEILYQSDRLPLYRQALDRLIAEGLAYPCFCTRSEIAAEVAASAAAPHGPDGPLYPGTCRVLAPDVRALRAASEPHALRLDVARAAALTGPLYWEDGDTEVEADPAAFGDVVLARKDAPTSYHLAVTVDDAAQKVTDIVRGRDLFAATDVHRLLQALLGLPTPHYHHHPLLTDGGGRRLAKRNGAPTLADLRAAGADPTALVAQLRAGKFPSGYSTAGE
ncbi:tRNA glutamyl-Q(34) synthetase GluQRS [Sphingosinicella sp. LY1275]|uniref:tRNA glutamyl-Q(34) synthetase GluQRS n=1 Tax=Sphingosinicella sp. LY1275 TaxID=3095379 RepID=UPI002ADEDDE5|nr:tRNA glutamyl-Q(34) synthetase GluQRS [Sphingosinicella sp. LY1275]MEA1014350.1 tRNA glutamyl-Q(34) synthetase GluQRS [Sphingosinicella sp. LY1275]